LGKKPGNKKNLKTCLEESIRPNLKPNCFLEVQPSSVNLGAKPIWFGKKEGTKGLIRMVNPLKEGPKWEILEN